MLGLKYTSADIASSSTDTVVPMGVPEAHSFNFLLNVYTSLNACALGPKYPHFLPGMTNGMVWNIPQNSKNKTTKVEEEFLSCLMLGKKHFIILKEAFYHFKTYNISYVRSTHHAHCVHTVWAVYPLKYTWAFKANLNKPTSMHGESFRHACKVCITAALNIPDFNAFMRIKI